MKNPNKPIPPERRLHNLNNMSLEQNRRIEKIKTVERGAEENSSGLGKSGGATDCGFCLAIWEVIDGEVSELDEVMETLKTVMRRVLENVDKLRGSTMRKVMEVLSLDQTVAVVAEFQLWIRRCGLERDK